MSNDIASLLARFSDAHGLAGYEDEVADLLQSELAPYVDEVQRDILGNVIATRRGEGPEVMIAAHIDEIGLMVTHIEEEGFLRVVPVGGWFDQMLLGQRVIVHTRDGKRLPGVVGSRPPHIMDEEERKKVVKLKTMFVDFGARSVADAEKLGVEVGSPITIDRHLVNLANGFVTGKALDNRAGVVMMVAALRRLASKKVKATVYAVGTVQEEVGLKGARTSAYGLSPDVAIATDVTITGDHPGVTRAEAHPVAGAGPVITVLDAGGRGLIAPRPVLRWLRAAAERAAIPYQLEAGGGGTTDATAIHLTKAGIPTGVISVPTRYIHSPVEVVSLDDLEKGAELVAE
ncbi:MAG: M42 family metallopeptidase, partial [Thermoleophilia bacterium]|nr:M42 family metallopeptidase [Thermoleophilia bacterium]